MNPDLKSEVGPVYNVDNKHSYGCDFSKEQFPKETHGPVYQTDHKHGYQKDFSVKHRDPSPTAYPVMNADRKHNYKAPLNKPHQRDLRSRSYTPSYEMHKSHHYVQGATHKSDLSEMHGPIYNTGKINDLAKHSFKDGYEGTKVKQDQVELVSKFFKQEKQEKREVQTLQTQVIQKAESVQQEFKKVTVAEASVMGEERRVEAVQRRQEFLKEQEDLHMKITKSEFKTFTVKSRRELEEERELYLRNAIERVQEEATSMKNRQENDEKKRFEMFRMEEERIATEDRLRQEAMLRAEEERKIKESARLEELRKQKELMASQLEKKKEMERLRL